jgi:hypothetical protein
MTLLAGFRAGIARPLGRVERSGELELAWDESPWIDVHDDGKVLALVDGVLHGVKGSAAREVHRRYLAQAGAFAAGLVGDFTAAILDRQAGRLLVARDPLGVRPWYVTASGTRHAGAGSLAELVALPWVDTAVDEASVVEYLAAVSRSVGPTLYRAITTLAPGHTWLVGTGDPPLSRPHHQWEIEPDLGISWDDAAERCREVLDTAVADRLASPTTCELSGGLDSSSVVGTAVRLGADRLAAARLVFETPNADERRYSDAVVEHWSIDMVSQPPWVPTDEEATELTRRLARPLPDPQFTMFADLHRTLSQMSRPDGLTGLGGDDAFLTARVPERLLSAVRLRQPTEVLRVFREQGASGAWSNVVKPTLHRLAGRGDRLPGWLRASSAASAGLDELFRARPRAVTGVAGIDQRIGNITSGYDAAILETRAVISDLSCRRETHPFLDPRFILATYGLDPAWPTRHGHVRALEIEAFGDRLPELVAHRNSKAEFSEVFWPQVLAEEVVSRVRTGPLVDNGWLDPDGFDRLVAGGRSGRPNMAIPLARCVAVDRWLRTF